MRSRCRILWRSWRGFDNRESLRDGVDLSLSWIMETYTGEDEKFRGFCGNEKFTVHGRR
jgi:hypothetical protein